MVEYQYGVQYPYDGAVFETDSDRDEMIEALLWAMGQREILYLMDDYQARWFDDARLVVRERDDETNEWGAWAIDTVDDQELAEARESAREAYGYED